MSKFDMTDDELREFVKLNKEKIVEFIKEEAPGIKAEAKKAGDELNKLNDKANEKFKEIKDDGKQFISALTSQEVQKHFISAGMEFMLGFMQVIKSIPVPDSMEPIKNKVSEVRSTASEAFCTKNPECMRKRTVEKIEID